MESLRELLKGSNLAKRLGDKDPETSLIEKGWIYIPGFAWVKGYQWGIAVQRGLVKQLDGQWGLVWGGKYSPENINRYVHDQGNLEEIRTRTDEIVDTFRDIAF